MRGLLTTLLLVFCLSAALPGTIQLVQEADGNNQGTPNTSLSVAFSQNTAAGDLIVVYVAPATILPGTISVTDSIGNAYTAAASTLTTGITGCNISQEFFYTINRTSGSDTVTATTTTTNGMGIVALEYSGVASTSPLDQQAGTSTTTCPWNVRPASASFTTTNASDLIISGSSLTANSTWTAGTSYTLRATQARSFSVEDQVVSLSGTYAGTFSLSAPSNWIAAAVAFKAAPSPGTPTCGLSGDTTNHLPGSDWTSPPLPAEHQSYTDPTFGCTVVRLTDGSSDVSTDSAYNSAGTDCATQHSNGPSLSMFNYYSTFSPMNSTDTLVLISSSDGGMRIKDTAGNLVILRCNMPSMNDTRVVWDASNGNVFYYAYGNSLMSGTIAGSTVATATVHQFTEYTAIDLMDAPDVSQDGQNVVIVGGDRTGLSPENVFTYNFVTNTKGSTYTTTCTGSVDGPNNGCLHKLQLTPNNNVVIQFEYQPSPCTPGVQPDEEGVRLWTGTLPLVHLQDCNTNHLDTGYDLNGNPIFIELGNSSVLQGEANPCQSGWGLDTRQLGSLSSVTCLLDNPPAWHVSYRGSSAQPWATLSFFDSRATSPEWFNTSANYTTPTASNWALYEDEIILVRVDENNNPANNSSVYRLARAYSRSDESYTAQPHAAVSRDGKYVIFNSNMAHVNGCPSGSYVANDCSDVYLIKVH